MEGFTVGLALLDAVPVLFFAGSMLCIYGKFDSPLFLIGAMCSVLAGLFKVIWKLILGTAKKDVRWLNKGFLPLQITGFLLILTSLIVGWKKISLRAIGAALVSFPSVLFFLLFITGMVAMSVYVKRFDHTARANWMAEMINSVAQGALFVGLMLL